MVQEIAEAVLDKLKTKIPLRRLVEPSEIAHSIRYIIENDYFTSRTISVDDGLHP